jgi:hypothetical protein
MFISVVNNMKYPLQYLCLLLAILFTNANSAFANGFEQQVGQLRYVDGSLPLGLIAVLQWLIVG